MAQTRVAFIPWECDDWRRLGSRPAGLRTGRRSLGAVCLGSIPPSTTARAGVARKVWRAICGPSMNRIVFILSIAPALAQLGPGDPASAGISRAGLDRVNAMLEAEVREGRVGAA